MLVRRGVATAVFAGLLSAPAIASAQAFSVNPSATVAAGYAATESLPDDPNGYTRIVGAPFASLGPALALTYETPRVEQSLQLAATGTLPIAPNFTFHELPPSVTARANYTSHIALTELWNLTLGLAFSAIPMNPLVSAVDASDTPVESTPDSFSYNLGLTGNQSLTREISPTTRVTQSANVLYNFPLNTDPVAPIRATTLTVKGSIAVTHNFALDAISATVNIGYNHFGRAEGADSEPRDQFLNTLIGTWHRPLTASLTASVDLGVLQAASPDATQGQLWQPTGGARLTYTFDYATASLGYTHAALANVFTSTLNLSDQLVLRASIPLADIGLGLSTSAGYTHTTPIATDGTLTLASASNIFLADVGLAYSPPPLPKLSVSVRGTYNRQLYVDDPVKSLTRLALNVNVGFSFPDARTAAVQNRIAPAYVPTPSLGSDSTPAPGIQPTPIEIIEAQEAPAAPAPAPAPASP